MNLKQFFEDSTNSQSACKHLFDVSNSLKLLRLSVVIFALIQIQGAAKMSLCHVLLFTSGLCVSRVGCGSSLVTSSTDVKDCCKTGYCEPLQPSFERRWLWIIVIYVHYVFIQNCLNGRFYGSVEGKTCNFMIITKQVINYCSTEQWISNSSNVKQVLKEGLPWDKDRRNVLMVITPTVIIK